MNHTSKEAIRSIPGSEITEDFFSGFPGAAQPTGWESFPIAKTIGAGKTCVALAIQVPPQDGAVTCLISFTVKAVDACTPVRISIQDGCTAEETYYLPVQWTTIGIPLKASGPVRISLEPTADILLAGAFCEYHGTDSIQSLSLRTGMHLLEPFVDVSITDSGNPLVGKTKDLIKNGKLLYSIGNGKLTITDVTDPAAPVILSTLGGMGNDIRQLVMLNDGRHIFISSRQNGCYIVKVSDPAHPAIVSRYDSVEMATGVDAWGDYVFVCNRQYGVEIVDIRDVYHPIQKAIVRCGTAQSCRVVDGILYAGCWNEREIQMFDVTQPTAPKRLGSVSLHGKGDGMAIMKQGEKTYLYAATGQHVAGCPEFLQGTTEDLRLSNLKYGQGNGLDIFDITDPTDPKWLSTSRIDGRYYFPDNDFWDVEVSRFRGRCYAYFLNTYNGVYIFDVTDPAAPIRLGRVTVVSDRIKELVFPTRACILPYDQSVRRQSPTSAIVCDEGVLYIASSMTDLHICTGTELDKFLHPSPEKRGAAPIPSSDGDFYAFDPKKYGLSGFARYACTGQVYAVVAHNGKIYAACGKEGIAVLDENLGLLARLDTQDIAMDVQIKNGTLYCAESNGGLGAYDLSDDGLRAVEKWHYKSSHGVVRQVRLSPQGRWAIIQCGPSFGEIISTHAPTACAAECKSSTLMYHHNILNTIAGGRYLAIYADGEQAFWYDFGVNDDYDTPVLQNKWPSNRASIMTGGMTGNVPGFPDYVLCTAGIANGRPGGYVIYDPASDNTPVITAVDPETAFSGRPAIFETLLVASDRINGKIHLVDLSDLQAPHVMKTIPVAGNPDNAVRMGRYLLIPMGYQGLFRFDITPFVKPKKEKAPCAR